MRNEDRLQLNKDERALYLLQVQTMFRGFQNLHFQWRTGLLDAAEWETFVISFEHMTSQTGYHYYWDRRSHLFGAAFRTWVEERFTSGA